MYVRSASAMIWRDAADPDRPGKSHNQLFHSLFCFSLGSQPAAGRRTRVDILRRLRVNLQVLLRPSPGAVEAARPEPPRHMIGFRPRLEHEAMRRIKHALDFEHAIRRLAYQV